MEKKSNSQSHKLHYATAVSTIFYICFNLVLLTFVSWVLLIGWFGIMRYWNPDCSGINQVQKMLNNEIYKNHLLSNVLAKITQIQCYMKLSLNYLVDSPLNDRITAIIFESTQIIIMRLNAFILMIPSFMLINFIFVIDGLVQRDIRKFKGARESTFFFHRVKSFLKICFFTLFFVYMAVPIAILPEIILIPMMLLTSYFTLLSITNYKKYL